MKLMRSFIFQIIPRQPRVNVKVLDKLSDIFIGVGHLMIGSIALPYIVDKFDPSFIMMGVLSALISWSISILLILE